MIDLENVIVGLDIIAELEWVDTSFEARWVVTALGREKACEMSKCLAPRVKEKYEEREKTLSFPLCFLLEIKVKVTSLASSISIAISILEEDVGARSEL